MSDKIEMNTLAEMPSEYLASELPFSLLIEILRKQGFVIGLDSMEAMYFLLQKAIHAEQLHKLPFWLCPVVAQSAEQQAIFMELYKRTMLPVVDVKEEVKDKKERIENKQTETNTQISEPTIVQSKPEIKEQRKKIVASLKACPANARIINRFPAQVLPVYENLWVKQVRRLRYTRETQRRIPDMPATIRKAILSQGSAPLVWTYGRQHAEYLFLVDRNNERDHMALWYNSFYESLLYNNVQVTRFYFDHHPDVLFNEKYKTGIEFREIMHRFSHAMLFVFADGMQFVNPVTQKLYAWVGELAVFPHRILFSSVSVGFWGKREQLLQHIFQMIVPFTRNGLMAINEWISGNSSSEIFNIPYWQNQVEQNFSAIDTADIDLRELEIYYNTPMRRWIAACAIYPELNWNLTLALGQLLSSEKNPLHTYSHLAQLIQLDWFANGYIPDKYRLLLITQWLTKEDITRIHEFLYNQLSRIKPLEEEAEYEAYALQLAIHELLSRKTKTDFENTFAALTPKVEKKIRIRDLVNIYLINQHKLSPVEFEIPEKWLQKMGLAQYVSTDTPSFSSYTETATGVPFDMVAVKGGTFKIGSGADAGDETSPPYDISVPDFYMGKTEVTVAEFKTFVDATGYISEAENNIGFKGSRMWTSSKWEDKEGVYWRCDVNGKIRNTSEYNHPVIHVSWNDAKAYCEWLSTKTGKTYRLPSEAEWEYAAGASTGSATNASSGSAIANETLTGSGTLSGLRNKWAGTNDENLLHEYAWYSKNSGGTTQPAATRKANPLGLYDMSGNVWEWCEDDWHDKYDGIPRDGKAWVDATRGSSRLLRGGSWDDDADDCRVAYRDNVSPSYRSNYVGFRLSRNL